MSLSGGVPSPMSIFDHIISLIEAADTDEQVRTLAAWYQMLHIEMEEGNCTEYGGG